MVVVLSTSMNQFILRLTTNAELGLRIEPLSENAIGLVPLSDNDVVRLEDAPNAASAEPASWFSKIWCRRASCTLDGRTALGPWRSPA